MILNKGYIIINAQIVGKNTSNFSLFIIKFSANDLNTRKDANCVKLIIRLAILCLPIIVYVRHLCDRPQPDDQTGFPSLQNAIPTHQRVL